MRLVVALLALGALVVVPAVGAVSYRATLAPREAFFGDPVEAKVDVVVDPRTVDPSRIRVHTDFRPYEAAPQRVTRRAAAGLVHVQFAYRLTCLVRRCLTNGPERTVSFAPVRVTAGTQTQTLRWPNLRVASRVDPHELSRPTPRSDVVRQPAVTWAVAPGPTTAVLVALALALLAYPAVLVGRAAHRAWVVHRTSRLDRMTPLERALELLRRAGGQGDDRSRRALERVARELGPDELGEDARRLAWSRPQPDPDSMESLRTRVEDAR